MVEDFRQDGTMDWESDRLKILVKTPASWSAQSPTDAVGTSCLPRVDSPQHTPHVMLFHSEDDVVVGCRMWHCCLWWFYLEAGKEVVQLLRQ